MRLIMLIDLDLAVLAFFFGSFTSKYRVFQLEWFFETSITFKWNIGFN